LLSIPEVINCLDNRFDVYGSSPRFLTDWRWYKDIIGENREFNKKALNNYYETNLNLLDYRFEFSAHPRSFGEKLEELGTLSWDLMCNIENGNSSVWQDFFALMHELSEHIKKLAPHTVEAIREVVTLLQTGHPDMVELKQFPEWWGRGQQYLSLVRNGSVYWI
jgi:hypothetical protein